MHIKKNKIFILFISVILLSLLVIFICYFYNINKKPKIQVIVKLQNLSDDEYHSLSNNNLNDQIVKKLFIHVEIINSPKCKIRDIYIPELNAIDHIDFIRSYNEQTDEENNIKDNYAKSTKYIIYNSTNLSIKDLKEIYNSKNITISLVTESDKKMEYHYNIGKLLEESEL